MLLSCISFSRISDSMSMSLANLHVSQSLLFSLPFFLSPSLLFPKRLELIVWALLPCASGFRNKCRNWFGQLLRAWYLYIHQIFGKKNEILRHAVEAPTTVAHLIWVVHKSHGGNRYCIDAAVCAGESKRRKGRKGRIGSIASGRGGVV